MERFPTTSIVLIGCISIAPTWLQETQVLNMFIYNAYTENNGVSSQRGEWIDSAKLWWATLPTLFDVINFLTVSHTYTIPRGNDKDPGLQKPMSD